MIRGGGGQLEDDADDDVYLRLVFDGTLKRRSWELWFASPRDKWFMVRAAIV